MKKILTTIIYMMLSLLNVFSNDFLLDSPGIYFFKVDNNMELIFQSENESFYISDIYKTNGSLLYAREHALVSDFFQFSQKETRVIKNYSVKKIYNDLLFPHIVYIDNDFLLVSGRNRSIFYEINNKCEYLDFAILHDFIGRVDMDGGLITKGNQNFIIINLLNHDSYIVFRENKKKIIKLQEIVGSMVLRYFDIDKENRLYCVTNENELVVFDLNNLPDIDLVYKRKLEEDTSIVGMSNEGNFVINNERKDYLIAYNVIDNSINKFKYNNDLNYKNVKIINDILILETESNNIGYFPVRELSENVNIRRFMPGDKSSEFRISDNIVFLTDSEYIRAYQIEETGEIELLTKYKRIPEDNYNWSLKTEKIKYMDNCVYSVENGERKVGSISFSEEMYIEQLLSEGNLLVIVATDRVLK